MLLLIYWSKIIRIRIFSLNTNFKRLFRESLLIKNKQLKRKKYTQVQRIALAEKIISQLFIAYEKLNLRIQKIETIIKKQDNE